MTIETPELALLGMLAIMLVVAAVTDWRRRSIDNVLTGAVAVMAPLYWWATGLDPWPGIAIQLLVAGIVFAIGLGLFAMGAMGGGDIKLLTGLALWFPPLAMLRLAIIMSLIGGILTLFMLIRHKMSKSATPPEIPYGIAISLAGLWAIYERNLNQFG